MSSSPPISNSQLPRTSGGFVLVKELGRGGMGVVYQARELSSGREVALKVLAKELVVSTEAFERFRREARLAASISDSRCVFVYGAHEVEGAPAISMELCGGETLEHRIKTKEPIPIASAVQWTLEILEGLEAAQRSGIVHRDVKPSNCFISEDGKVKVGDFGLSRSLDHDVGLTQSGVFLGSPLYASPEQIKGRAVDLRSDVYSTGATLYALLTGQPPYTGQNIGEVLARILSEPPPAPRSIRREIPRGLEKVVLRAMERDPEKRFRDHASFREALAPFAARSHEAGGLRRRFVAYIVDSQVIGLLNTLTVATLGLLGWKFDKLIVDAQNLPTPPWLLIITAVETLTYFGLLEGWRGQTLGKWVLGLRVVSNDNDQPALGRACARCALYFAPQLLLDFSRYMLSMQTTTYAFVSVVGGITCALMPFVVARRRNGWRALHDMASGMRVVRLPSPFARFRRALPPPTADFERGRELPARIGSYEVEGAIGVTPSGMLLQARDPGLARSVWILPRASDAHCADDGRRSLVRTGRLRWLDSLREADARFDVYEAPGGTSLIAYARARDGLDWSLAQRCLTALADEVATLPPDARVCVEQLWIDRSWNLRLLDEPVGRGPLEQLLPLTLLVATARCLLPAARRAGARLPPDLPAYAEPAARKLFGLDPPFEDVAKLRTALGAWSNRPATLTFKARALQLALGSAAAIVTLVVASVVTLAVSLWMLDSVRAAKYINDVREARAVDAPTRDALSEDALKARQILIAVARDLDSPSTRNIKLGDEDRAVLQEARALFPAPSAEDVAWASAQLGVEHELLSTASIINKAKTYVPPALLAIACVWGMFSSIFALTLRGGLSFSILGMRVRTSRGELASRWRCLLRSLVVWVPLALLYALPAQLMKNEQLVAAYEVLAIVMIAHLAVVAHALWRPTRGLADRIVGTRLVPR